MIYLDGSVPTSHEEILVSRFGRRVSLLGSSRRCGPATGRNVLANAAVADLIVFFDSDVILPPGLSTLFLQEYKNREATTMLAPRIIPARSRTLVENFFTVAILSPMLRSTFVFVPTACLAIPLALWHQLPDFDERFPEAGGEDYSWFLAVNQDPLANVSLAYLYSATVSHVNPRSIFGLARRAHRYGRWAYLHRKTGNGIREKIGDPTVMTVIDGPTPIVARTLLELLHHAAGSGTEKILIYKNRVFVNPSHLALPLHIALLVFFKVVYGLSSRINLLRYRRATSTFPRA